MRDEIWEIVHHTAHGKAQDRRSVQNSALLQQGTQERTGIQKTRFWMT